MAVGTKAGVQRLEALLNPTVDSIVPISQRRAAARVVKEKSGQRL